MYRRPLRRPLQVKSANERPSHDCSPGVRSTTAMTMFIHFDGVHLGTVTRRSDTSPFISDD